MFKLLLMASLLILIFGSLSCSTAEVSVTDGDYSEVVTTEANVTPEEEATETPAETSILIRVKREMHGDGQIETLDMETEYLPVVVACENYKAPYESLKAQAIAARTFALFKILHEPRSDDYDILDYEEDQVYNPALLAALPQREQDSVIWAVEDTEGLIIRHAGNVICSFYVSGEPHMLQYVTFNEGKSGSEVTQTTLDGIYEPGYQNPYNRGCMGQIQANELAEQQDYDYEEILEYFYGSDISIEYYQPDG